MFRSVFIPIFEVVLLAAIEFNREDEKVSVEETERKPLNSIHCPDENKEGKMVTNEELGTKDQIARNVEAAWTSKSKSVVGKEQTCCVSWYNIFRFLGKIENLNCCNINVLLSRKGSFSRRCPCSFWTLYHGCHVLLLCLTMMHRRNMHPYKCCLVVHSNKLGSNLFCNYT